MKHLYICLICTTLLVGCVSTQIMAPSENMVQHVLEFPGISKANLYRATNEWMVQYFVSAESVIQYQDKEEGVITGKGRGYFNVGGIGKPAVTYVLTIEVKDSKARLTFKDYFIDGAGSFGAPSSKSMPYFKDHAQGMAWDYEEGIKRLLNKSW